MIVLCRKKTKQVAYLLACMPMHFLAIFPRFVYTHCIDIYPSIYITCHVKRVVQLVFPVYISFKHLFLWISVIDTDRQRERERERELLFAEFQISIPDRPNDSENKTQAYLSKNYKVYMQVRVLCPLLSASSAALLSILQEK